MFATQIYEQVNKNLRALTNKKMSFLTKAGTGTIKLLPHARQNSHELMDECLFTNANNRRTGGHTFHKMQRAASTYAMVTEDELYIAARSLFICLFPLTKTNNNGAL